MSAMIDRFLLAVIAVSVAYVAIVAHFWFEDYRAAKAELHKASVIAEHCRIMRATGIKSSGCP